MTVLRSLLFVPGNRSNMLEKALGLAPDALVPDLEDSVPVEEKGFARDTVSSYLPRLAEAQAVVIPRVNAKESGLLEEDLAAVVGPHVYGVSVGKIRSAEDVRHISDLLARLEKRVGLEIGGIHLVPWIETALAVVNAYQICAASPRVVAVAFGAEDFANDMGAYRTEVNYPKSVVCVAARAADVLALDTPFVSFRDPDGLRRDSRAARGYGFSGKFAIHPEQVKVINQEFAPSRSEIAQAHRVLAVFEEAMRSGKGSVSLDGEMIDAPVVKRARSLLELAQAVSRRDLPGARVGP